VRDGAGVSRLRAVAGDGGCQSCHTHQSCTERCPKHLSPTAAIAGLKRLVALAALKGTL
jgi:fumarate reductase iron-sulfur subunit